MVLSILLCKKKVKFCTVTRKNITGIIRSKLFVFLSVSGLVRNCTVLYFPPPVTRQSSRSQVTCYVYLSILRVGSGLMGKNSRSATGVVLYRFGIS